MKTAGLCIVALTLGYALEARATTVLYDNTNPADNTYETVFYSIGPFSALGDQIQLVSSGTADQAEAELYNNGNAGTFDAQLNFFNVGSSPSSPVGSFLGSYDVDDITSVGGDVLDITFNLDAGLAVPQNLNFTINVSGTSPNMDLGVDMFDGPDVGSSDPFYMIAEQNSTYMEYGTDDENVYFELSGTTVAMVGTPETSSLVLLGSGLLMLAIARARRRPQFQ